MSDNHDNIVLSTSLEIYIISNLEYVLKYSFNGTDEYFYSSLKRTDGIDPVKTIRGAAGAGGKIIFEGNNGFRKEIMIMEMEKLTHRKIL